MRKRDKVKGLKARNSGRVLIVRGTLHYDNYDILFIPSTRFFNDYSICELSCVQLFLHVVVAGDSRVSFFPVLFARRLTFFPLPYNSFSFPQSNQWRLPREASVEKKGTSLLRGTNIVIITQHDYAIDFDGTYANLAGTRL